MKISIIIPTHNRAESLKRAIDSISMLKDEAKFELIIVDNNSTDHTKEVVESYSGIARYVFEGSTSFTKARGTGAENASGDIFLYLDDDVIVHPGSIREIASVFSKYPDCGVIAGKILPQFEEEPPDWTLACEQSFNGWSLMNPNIWPILGTGFQDFGSACGPMMAIRKKPYFGVNGFPPDTVGVETNTRENTFRKLYIGPGDYGLCHKIRKYGYKVYYSPRVSCYHVVLKVRLTVPFWRSRMIGEGHHKAITNRELYNYSNRQLWLERINAKYKYEYWKKMLYQRLKANEAYILKSNFSGMFFEELWVHYFKAYLDMDRILLQNSGLSKFLWGIGLNGVADNEFEQVVNKLPIEYLSITSSEKMYTEKLIISIDTLESFGFPPSGNLLLLSKLFFYLISRIMIRVKKLLF
ncbi:MAG: glycosyltransferase family 2 protein [Bacteroidetes bacterium]|nr:glycosyltransferase family 2 protein [Bacteroidota bacterium]